MNAPVYLGRSILESCQAEFGHPVANQLQGEAVFGFFVDQQIDEGEPLRLVGRFGQQSAIALVIKLCVQIIHDPLGTDPSASDCSAAAAGAQVSRSPSASSDPRR